MRRLASPRVHDETRAAREAAFPVKLKRDAVRLLFRGHVRQSELSDPWRTPTIASRAWSERLVRDARTAGLRAWTATAAGRRVVVLADPSGTPLASPGALASPDAELELVDRAADVWTDALERARAGLVASAFAELDRSPALPAGPRDAVADYQTLVASGRVVIPRARAGEPVEQRWQLHVELLAAQDGLMVTRAAGAAGTLALELADRDGRPFARERELLTAADLRTRARAAYRDVLVRAAGHRRVPAGAVPGGPTATPVPAIGSLLRRPGEHRAG